MNLTEINGCVIICTYNNQKTLARVIDGVLNYCNPKDLIVVNDGSTDETPEILNRYLILNSKNQGITVLVNERNTGKGYSLRKGFKEAIARGYENAITIDSDGQHYPDDIPNLFEAAKQHPGALLMGARNMDQASVPGKSSFGNKFSNFWFWVETGITLPDTQTGFRLYPLAPLKKIKLYTNKFETEIEVIVKLAWRHVKIIPVNVKVLYDMNERVSHFRPFKDFIRISFMNAYLVTLTILWYLPKRLLHKVSRKSLWHAIYLEAVKPDETKFLKSASIGFGFFISIFPIWGFQLLLGIPLAIFLRLNKVLFIAAANFSIPPMIPFIVFASYWTGSFFVTTKTQFQTSTNLSLESIHINFFQYVVGALVLSVITGVLTFAVTYFLTSYFRNKNKAQS